MEPFGSYLVRRVRIRRRCKFGSMTNVGGTHPLAQLDGGSAGLVLAKAVLARRPGRSETPSRLVNRLLHSLRPLPATDMIAHRAGELRRCYRRSHGSISLVDYLIAATAQVHGLEIVTL